MTQSVKANADDLTYYTHRNTEQTDGQTAKIKGSMSVIAEIQDYVLIPQLSVTYGIYLQ